MVCCTRSNILKAEEEISLSSIKDKIRPLDLMAFRASDCCSDIVFKSELARQKLSLNKGYVFTHVGIIITKNIFNNPNMEDGKLYMLESTVCTNIPDIEGVVRWGVQIRDLEQVIKDYETSNDTLVAWCPLLNNPSMAIDTADKFRKVYDEIRDKKWDANGWSLASALCECLRPCRCCMEHLFGTEDWLFCSEMVAIVYKALNILPTSINPKDVVPDDLVNPKNDSDYMPVITDIPIFIKS